MPKPAPKTEKRKVGGYYPPTAGELLSVPTDVVFWIGQRKHSAYDELLNRLFEAGDGQCLKFATTRCRNTVNARAKKLGYKLAFGERAGELFVKIVAVAADARPVPAVKSKAADSKSGQVSARADQVSLSTVISRIVAEAPRSNAEVYDHVEQYLPDAKKSAVDATLANMQHLGQIAKRDDLKWYPVKLAGLRRAS